VAEISAESSAAEQLQRELEKLQEGGGPEGADAMVRARILAQLALRQKAAAAIAAINETSEGPVKSLGAKVVGRPFKKGQSGNPGGIPKGTADVRAAARQHTDRAIARLKKAIDSKDERVAVEASKAMLDRGWGRPVQALSGPDEGPVVIDFNIDLRNK